MVAGETNPVEVPLPKLAETVRRRSRGARRQEPRSIFRRAKTRRRRRGSAASRGGDGRRRPVPCGHVSVGGTQRLRFQAGAVEGMRLDARECGLQPGGASRNIFSLPPLKSESVYRCSNVFVYIFLFFFWKFTIYLYFYYCSVKRRTRIIYKYLMILCAECIGRRCFDDLRWAATRCSTSNYVRKAAAAAAAISTNSKCVNHRTLHIVHCTCRCWNGRRKGSRLLSTFDGRFQRWCRPS